MKFCILIDCENSAFDNREEEIERIIEEYLEAGIRETKLRDINGNIVGEVFYRRNISLD